jgi:hypothetical protein
VNDYIPGITEVMAGSSIEEFAIQIWTLLLKYPSREMVRFGEAVAKQMTEVESKRGLSCAVRTRERPGSLPGRIRQGIKNAPKSIVCCGG